MTTPLVDPIVATLVLLLVHTPPNGTSLYDAVAPAHTVAGPVMGDGDVLTDIVS